MCVSVHSSHGHLLERNINWSNEVWMHWFSLAEAWLQFLDMFIPPDPPLGVTWPFWRSPPCLQPSDVYGPPDR